MRKTVFCIYPKTKTQISFAVTAKLIRAFVFATQIVESLYFLNPKFQASSHLLWLYRLVCVGPGRKPLRPVFSQRGSYVSLPLVRVQNRQAYYGLEYCHQKISQQDVLIWPGAEWPSVPKQLALARVVELRN